MLAMAVAVGSCASGDSPPDNIENACAIFQDRPGWASAIADSERRWGAPAEIQLAIMWRESRFVDDARPPRTYLLGIVPWGRMSSAHGYSQALDGTWDWYRDHSGNRGADRRDFRDAADFVGWYMNRTAEANGATMSDAYTHYLAYHEGHTGYRRGDWRRKGWLMEAAREVETMAARYRHQLANCRGAYTA